MRSRPYEPSDLPDLLNFLAIARLPGQTGDFPARADLEEFLSDPQISAQTHLWLQPSGKISAYALLISDSLVFDTLPALQMELGPEIIRWAMGMGIDVLYSNCLESNLPRQTLLQSQGFARTDDFSLRYSRSLGDPIPAPELPPGFSIRPLKGESEAPAAAELHRAAFQSDYMTTDRRLAIMRTSTYLPELDLVVVAPDGRLAAYTIGGIDPATNTGSTDPVGTHPDFQRQGLARAVLLACMQKLRQRGVETVQLGTSGDNPSMQKTAESVGFRMVSKTLWYYKNP